MNPILTFDNYLKISRDRVINSLLISEYATITQKLLQWDTRGYDNEAWKNDPIISAGANRENITEFILNEIPYCLKLRDDISELIIDLNNETKPEKKGNGGVRLNYEKRTSYELISLLLIPIQFSLLEYFEFCCYFRALTKGRVHMIDQGTFTLKDLNEKGANKITSGRIEFQMNNYKRLGILSRIPKWKDIDIPVLENDYLNIYDEISKRRNTLIHEIDFNNPTLAETIEYFKNCRKIAFKINEAFINI